MVQCENVMQDLHTQMQKELTSKVKDFRGLLSFLSDSFYGAEHDLSKIRDLYRDFNDMKAFYVSKNNTLKSSKERSFSEDYQGKIAMDGYINRHINPFIDMLKFIIELYEANK